MTDGVAASKQVSMSDRRENSGAERESAPFAFDDLRYALPTELIAQQPLAQRDGSRLLVVDRSAGTLTDAQITDLPQLLRSDDLLVLNDTKVLSAKFFARRTSGGGIRGLFEREVTPGEWVVMLAPSKRLRVGELLRLVRAGEDGVAGAEPGLELQADLGGGRWQVVYQGEGNAAEVLERFGMMPLPPYIRRGAGSVAEDMVDRERYQTVYARRSGAVAAPTAGLHLTGALLDRIEGVGVETAYVTLHVGAGTFAPIRAGDLSRHEMHAEWYELREETAAAVRRCRDRGGRVMAVGTTSVRVLETSADASRPGSVRSGCGETDIFILPPYRFQVVDALLTNFHLPESTLLALVMAMAGVEPVRRAYRHAIADRYRFFSYGDAMLIL